VQRQIDGDLKAEAISRLVAVFRSTASTSLNRPHRHAKLATRLRGFLNCDRQIELHILKLTQPRPTIRIDLSSVRLDRSLRSANTFDDLLQGGSDKLIYTHVISSDGCASRLTGSRSSCGRLARWRKGPAGPTDVRRDVTADPLRAGRLGRLRIPRSMTRYAEYPPGPENQPLRPQVHLIGLSAIAVGSNSTRRHLG